MNRKLLMLTTAAVTLLLICSASWAEIRIAAVNINKILTQAPQTQDADSQMQGKFSSRQDSLIKEQDALKQLEDKYRVDKDVISTNERDKLESQLREKMREFKRKSGEFNEDFSLARNKALSTLQEDVYKAIVTVAERENYDLVVSESVLYASEKIDITQKVLHELKLLGDQ